MIKLFEILKEEVNPVNFGKEFFQEFNKQTDTKLTFKYLGLKNKEYIYTAPVSNLGVLNLIISDAIVMARITEKYAYFGIVYTLNGLEQFDATICVIKKIEDKLETKLFDDSDSDFSDAKTKFASLIKVMV